MVQIVDGDTIRVEAYPWPGVVMRDKIRLSTVDAPARRGRAKCPRERELGEAAARQVASIAPVGSKVQLYEIKLSKYGDRKNARIVTLSGDLGEHLFRQGLAKPSSRETGRHDWCE